MYFIQRCPIFGGTSIGQNKVSFRDSFSEGVYIFRGFTAFGLTINVYILCYNTAFDCEEWKCSYAFYVSFENDINFISFQHSVLRLLKSVDCKMN